MGVVGLFIALVVVGALCGALLNVKAFIALVLVTLPAAILFWWEREVGLVWTLLAGFACLAALQIGYALALALRARRVRARSPHEGDKLPETPR